QRAVRFQRQIFESGPRRLGHLLPRNQVAVVLRRRQDDLVPRTQPGPGITVGHQVEGGSGAPGEDHFLFGAGSDKPAHLFPCPLVGLGRPGSQGVNPPVDVGVDLLVIPFHRLDHLKRFLGAGGAVKIYQRVAVHFLLQDGKIPSIFVHCCSFLSITRFSCCLSDSKGIAERTGARKPKMISFSASSREMPRDIRYNIWMSSIRPTLAAWPAFTSFSSISRIGLASPRARELSISTFSACWPSALVAPFSILVMPLMMLLA